MKNKVRLEEEIGGTKFIMFNDITLGTIYQEVDGFYVFQPNNDRGGFWNENYLFSVGTLIANLNKPLNEHLRKFEKESHNNMYPLTPEDCY